MLILSTLELNEKEKNVQSIPMGQKAYYSKTISEADVTLFAGITGDSQPLSTNAEFAAATSAGRCAVQSELLASYTWPVSTCLLYTSHRIHQVPLEPLRQLPAGAALLHLHR